MEFSSEQETTTDCLNSRFPGKARVSGVGEDKEGFSVLASGSILHRSGRDDWLIIKLLKNSGRYLKKVPSGSDTTER